MSNSLDPDQDRRSVGPDLGPNCLQRLSSDDKKSPPARKELSQSKNIYCGCSLKVSNVVAFKEQRKVIFSLRNIIGIYGLKKR